MRKVLIYFISLLLFNAVQAQDFDFYISSPDPVPDPLAFCEGDSITFTLDYTGMGYSEWYKHTEEPDLIDWSNWNDWTNVGMSLESYTMAVNEEFYFWVFVSADVVKIPSEIFHITLKGEKPVISYTDTLFCDGTTLNITANPDTLGEGKYKWYKNGEIIENETSSTLTIDEEAIYTVGAITSVDCEGVYYMSETVKFYHVKPSIFGEFKPDLNRVALETTSEYSNYQWYNALDSTSELVEIEGATNYKYNANITSPDNYYSVGIVTDGGCIAKSERVLVNDSLYSLPVINGQTVNTLCRQDTLRLSLINSGYASYQWYKDGVMVWNGTEPTLYITEGQPTGPGAYTVVVKANLDENNTFESDTIFVNFEIQPIIGIMDNAELCPGSSVSLEAKTEWNGVAGGYDSYQWYFNDENDFENAVEISGANDSVIEIDVPNEQRIYWVKTTKNECQDVSNAKYIQEFELFAPYIKKDPWEGIICIGDTIIISVNSQDVTYQWYFNDKLIEGAIENEFKAIEPGYYDIEIASTVCESADPIMNKDSAVIKYRFNPSFSVVPEGDQWGDNPNHRIFCNGDTISLMVDNATNFQNWQWMGKLFDINSPSDEWEDVDGQADSVYTFINGQNNKLRYKVRVDSMMDNGKVCSAISDFKIIDGHINQNPAIASYGNAELCDAGDSTLLHLGFAGDWDHMEWYLDGALIPNSNTDTIWAKEVGMWTITCYPNTCPNIPHSSGVGPFVEFMPEAEIWENDTLIYAMPELGIYYYQWYFNGEAMDMESFDIPWIIMKEDLVPGKYTVEVSNPSECFRVSEPYLVVGINEMSTNNISIFPNPVKEELNISITDASQVQSIEVYNSLGALVDQSNNIQNTISVPMQNFENGIYLIKVNYIDFTSNTYRVVKN